MLTYIVLVLEEIEKSTRRSSEIFHDADEIEIKLVLHLKQFLLLHSSKPWSLGKQGVLYSESINKLGEGKGREDGLIWAVN